MSAHTPGPWGIGDSDLPVSKLAVMTNADIGRKHSTIARVVDPDFSGMPLFEGLANARLIAAAPDLLQELKNIANADTAEWDDRTEFEAWAKSRARAAIAKATGVDQ